MAQFNLTDQTNLFKINYYKKSENMYNSANVLQGRLKKRFDFTGRQRFVSTPLSFSGGVGASSLPVANAGTYEGAVITAKKVYARAEIEREAIKASSSNVGAFVQATKETVQKAVESYMRNGSRILFGDGSSILGRGDGATNVTGEGSAANPYLTYINLTSGAIGEFLEAHFEEKDFVQIVTGLNAGDNLGGAQEGSESVTNLLEISAVNTSTGEISLVGASPVLAALAGVPPGAGVGPMLVTTGLCMQRSYGATASTLKEPMGLDGSVNVSSGSLYGITIQRRWSSTIVDAAGAGVTVDRMNNLMLSVEKKFGKAPNMIMTSYEQFQNILALLEDQKVYNLPNRNLKGALSFQGVEFMSTRGPIGLFVDRFCPKDKIYFLNDNYIECHHRPGFGWFDDDGTVFLRKADDDSYESRYGGYYENFITPTPHGLLKGLAV